MISGNNDWMKVSRLSEDQLFSPVYTWTELVYNNHYSVDVYFNTSSSPIIEPVVTYRRVMTEI